jgi:hypothetical protein
MGAPGTTPQPPPISPRSWRDREEFAARLRTAYPLFLVGAAFLAGALAASVAHARILASPYPLWILLGLNGGIAAVAGTGFLFVRPSKEPPPEDDPETIRVPRAAWERLLAERSLGRAPRPWDEAASRSAREPTPSPAARSGPAAPRAPVFRAPDPIALQQEVALLELQSLAESAVATAENLGAAELEAFADGSGEELARLATTLGLRVRSAETGLARLERLLREVPSRSRLALGPKLAEELEELAVRLARFRPSAAPRSGASETARDPQDEFERLLEELERTQGPTGRRAPGSGRPPSEGT